MKLTNEKFASDIEIKVLRINDYAQVYDLWCRTPGMGMSDADSYDNIERFLQRNEGLSFVCTSDGKIIGTILCGHDGRRGYIYHTVVDPDFRGKGIGRLLVEKSLERLKDLGIGKSHLFVFVDNVAGNAFWAHNGWTRRQDIYTYSKDI